MSKALVVLSGGMDSTTCMELAAREHDELEAISFYYGQKHKNELVHAEAIAEYYHAPWTLIELPKVFQGAGSTLVDPNVDNPRGSYEEVQDIEGESVSPTYVPYRNGNLLSLAASHALVSRADTIYAGMHAEDAAHWAYPDCTPEFLGAMANAIYIGTYRQVRLVTPLQWLSKSDVVDLGAQLGVPFHLTMSCYDGKSPACGTCPTCVGRINAFRDNSLVDPIEYEIEINWDGVTV